MQAGATIIAALAAGWFAETRGAVSAALGGVACVLPNFLFALRLRSLGLRRGRSFPLNFFLGELAKLVMTIALLAAIVRVYADLHWPSMLIGLALATQAMFLAFWKKN